MKLWNYYVLKNAGVIHKLRLKLNAYFDLRNINQYFPFQKYSFSFRVEQCIKGDLVRIIIMVKYWQFVNFRAGLGTATKVRIKELYCGEKSGCRKKQIIRKIIETFVNDNEMTNYLAKSEYGRHYYYPFEGD